MLLRPEEQDRRSRKPDVLPEAARWDGEVDHPLRRHQCPALNPHGEGGLAVRAPSRRVGIDPEERREVQGIPGAVCPVGAVGGRDGVRRWHARERVSHPDVEGTRGKDDGPPGGQPLVGRLHGRQRLAQPRRYLRSGRCLAGFGEVPIDLKTNGPVKVSRFSEDLRGHWNLSEDLAWVGL